jgi:hypothetical protein
LIIGEGYCKTDGGLFVQFKLQKAVGFGAFLEYTYLRSFGLFFCWIVYRLLERNWTKKRIIQSTDILDDDFFDEELNKS